MNDTIFSEKAHSFNGETVCNSNLMLEGF